MIRSCRAELTRLCRRRVLLITALIAAVVAVGGAAIVLAATKPAAEAVGASGRAPTIAELSRAGGGTQVFRISTSFAGTFLFVVFIGVIAVEFSRGTIRTMLLRQPRRVRLLTGKLLGLLVFAATTLACTEVGTWLAARVLAPGHDVATASWTSLHALGAGLTDYGAALLWVTGYAVLGTAVGVLLRSVPLALGIGIAWAGPIEHLVQNAWPTAGRIFPGLSLEAFGAGGTPDVTATHAMVLVVLYTVLAAVVMSAVFARRDVTA